MLAYIIRRLIGAVLMLLLVSLVTFGIFFWMPKLAGQTTDQIAASYVGKAPTAEAIAATKERLHLDQPVVLQYGHYLKGIVAGQDFKAGPEVDHCPAPCLGYSFRTSQPVLPQLIDRAPATLSLAAGAALLWLVSGVTIGVLSALRRGSFLDRAAMVIALGGVSLPIYFTGLLSLAIFSYNLKIFPGGGSYRPFSEDPLHWFESLVLPWVTLAFLYAAMYARLTRAGMLETLGEDYIRTARAKGLPEKTVITKHALRSSLTPILTVFGLDLGLLLGGAVLTENTFSIPGLGQLAIAAINGGDLPVVLGVTLLAATFVVLLNLVVDVLYAAIDPRVRLG
ncbi:ABC transporter permease [Actinomadura parmotrematis]|uniref:ABC transporter permease n=1 Tax=Actinomadura parmotrematis TaxID=2864039 RepID=A0ABS7FSL1_9ACTN|nr:ABC transporter permease [Actinomadura parmotrematis]MBW8483388.1 ABC transporter permease [Actinomadura parmotrematis]